MNAQGDARQILGTTWARGSADDSIPLPVNLAAGLLMPERAVRNLHGKLTRELGTAPPAAALAVEFGVSADAMQYRLVNLGLE